MAPLLAPGELRGAWIEPAALAELAGPAKVGAAIEAAAGAGLNAVFPPARSERLASVVLEAHARGLEVLPWIEADPAGEDATVRAALELCRAHDLDGLAVAEPTERLRAELRTLDPELELVARPALAAEAPKDAGGATFDLAALLADDAALARALREGPFSEDALPPWREEAGRRPSAPPIPPSPGSGTWTWKEPQGAPRFLAIDGGEPGHVTWAFEPPETGTYALYAWIPDRDDLAAKASFRVATAGGSQKTLGVSTATGRSRGWVFLAEARLKAGASIEVARLDAEEQDATLLTAAGPLLVLRSRRPAR